MKYGVHMSSFVIVVTPAEKELRELTSVDELPARVRADLEALCDEVSERFPEAEAIGETGAKSLIVSNGSFAKVQGLTVCDDEWIMIV